jgi:hypothetical protein
LNLGNSSEKPATNHLSYDTALKRLMAWYLKKGKINLYLLRIFSPKLNNEPLPWIFPVFITCVYFLWHSEYKEV